MKPNQPNSTQAKGVRRMNYKAVIEEQIRELQKVQDRIVDKQGYESNSCNVAKTIADLVDKANQY